MIIRDIIDYLRPDMNLIIKDYYVGRNEPFVVYNGEVQNLPYWVAEETFTADECIEVDGNSLIIDISKPVRNKDNGIKTNQKWLDTLDEKEVLLYLAGFLYHYDVGTIHDEQFSDKDWSEVFEPMIKYIQQRIGTMAFDKCMQDWFKNKNTQINN